ncbi:Asd/ArgC dimerization domain-containing protein [Gallibacterium trehalosifermentans]|uniref:Asd/ArgC dimerization domain-containing protein n=1 Tax=Gallibacterium trehalosifermentans TaxID=516935 RepID=A0ABV6H034_9PAST
MSSNINIIIAADFSLAEKLVAVLEQSQFVSAKVAIIEAEKFSEEQTIRFKGKYVEQLNFTDVDWRGYDYLLFAGNLEQVTHLAAAAEAGCIAIDMLGICAYLSDIPAIVPTVNNERVADIRQRNIASLPNPIISQLALALKPLLQQYQVTQLSVTSLLPMSYFGEDKIRELVGQTAQLLNGIPLNDEQQRLAFDVVPVCDQGDLNKQRILLAKVLPEFTGQFITHQLQVPVFYGFAQQITLSGYDLEQLDKNNLWQQSKLLQIHSEKLLTPVTNGEMESDTEQLPQLHLHSMFSEEGQLSLWAVSDERGFARARLAIELLQIIDEWQG